jgi:hypothetical protein
MIRADRVCCFRPHGRAIYIVIATRIHGCILLLASQLRPLLIAGSPTEIGSADFAFWRSAVHGAARMVDAPGATGGCRFCVIRCRLTCVKTNGFACHRLKRGLIETRREPNMAHYIARFMKDVLGENGHEAEICQRSVEIEASCLTDAAELAKAKFCKTENVGDWLLHADRVHIADAEFPS